MKKKRIDMTQQCPARKGASRMTQCELCLNHEGPHDFPDNSDNPRAALEEALTALMDLHDDSVFVCGKDDEKRVNKVLSGAVKALKLSNE